MAIRPQQAHPVPEPLVRALEALRHELNIPDDFPPAVHDAAVAAAAAPRLPSLDRTDLELVTIDPEGSRDLDQAVLIDTADTGFTVWYAIADVAATLTPESGGAPKLRRRRDMSLLDANIGAHLRQMREERLGRWQGSLDVPARSIVLCAGLGTERDDVLRVAKVHLDQRAALHDAGTTHRGLAAAA